MARRSYTRDARGRFASTPGGGARKAVKLPAPARRTAGSKPQKRRGLLIQRSAAAASKRKLKGLDPADQSLSGSLKRRAQKGAVTRTANRLKAAQQSGRRRLTERKGIIRPPLKQSATKGERASSSGLKQGRSTQSSKAMSKGLPSTAIRERSIPGYAKPGRMTRDISGPSTIVYGVPTRSGKFGTRSVGPGGKVTGGPVVAPRARKDRRVYVSSSAGERARTAVQRMSDGNYAVTTTRISSGPGGRQSKSVQTSVKTPAEMMGALRAAVQGALFGGRKRVGTKRIGRRVA